MPAGIDRAAILALNNAHAAATSLLSADRLDALLAEACHVGLLEAGRAGFLLAFNETAGYESPNFRWFQARYPRFIYVDRIVVAAPGQGHGRALYRALFEHAGDSRVGCEINLEPPNPGSDTFHAAMGFAEIGRAELAGGKIVRYLMRSSGALPHTPPKANS